MAKLLLQYIQLLCYHVLATAVVLSGRIQDAPAYAPPCSHTQHRLSAAARYPSRTGASSWACSTSVALKDARESPRHSPDHFTASPYINAAATPSVSFCNPYVLSPQFQVPHLSLHVFSKVIVILRRSVICEVSQSARTPEPTSHSNTRSIDWLRVQCWLTPRFPVVQRTPAVGRRTL